MLASQLILATGEAPKGWFEENSTLIVGIVGILVSGLVGPSVAARWTTRLERERDARARTVAQRDDLRGIVDEAAKALGGAVARLRPALEAQQSGQPLSQDQRDFLADLFTLGQRLRLRVPVIDPVVSSYDAAREQLIAVSRATNSQATFSAAATTFEDRRADFLDRARKALDAPVSDGGRADEPR